MDIITHTTTWLFRFLTRWWLALKFSYRCDHFSNHTFSSACPGTIRDMSSSNLTGWIVCPIYFQISTSLKLQGDKNGQVLISSLLCRGRDQGLASRRGYKSSGPCERVNNRHGRDRWSLLFFFWWRWCRCNRRFSR